MKIVEYKIQYFTVFGGNMVESEIYDILDCELKKVELSIEHYPYLFVVSDDVDIRNYFAQEISNFNNVITLNDMEIGEEDNILMESLKKQSVFLLNAEKKAELIRTKHGFSESYNALYYRLIFKREFLGKYKKSIIIVCDEDTIKPLLCENQSLVSVCNILFIDDTIKSIKEENVSYLKKKK